MADITLNFSSQWPTIQVAKVYANPKSLQEIPHNLGFPPLAIAFNNVDNSFVMQLIDVDDAKVYTPYSDGTYNKAPDYIVIYAVDISQSFDYTSYSSAVGDVLKDETASPIDLRNFLLHSRAVGPMVLSVRTKTFTTSDMNMSYTSPLNYATFQFGYLRAAQTKRWIAAPLAGQGWPVLNSDGFTSSTYTIKNTDGSLYADIGSIITLRNPAIITNNTTSVTI